MHSGFQRFMRHRPAVIGLVLLLVVLAAAALANVIYPGDPFGMVGKPFQPPFGEYLLGTDMLGRDMAAGVLYGARTTVLVGVVATVIATVVGVTIGGLAG